ncbi:hypothetical protein [Rothia sp. ZJ1223]|uniref:hypothetical protein n=1 Tax=Rothia sp. ZJ1223 TaxID=2811098 RepID=UPI0019570BE1|nr:hypothetical protein [Rothia sp. ZJ1223]MBM7050804.1 hypothetical protein [Rothia sp. ZJ1223]
MSFEDIFPQHWLPAKPLCANRKNGSYKRQTRERALEHAYIETNPLAMQSLIASASILFLAACSSESDVPAPTTQSVSPNASAFAQRDS